jgi:AraC-like DNA-binding protein
MVARRLDLLFIRALRLWAASDTSAHPGWLTAAMDPVIGPVLSAIHRDPARDWSFSHLAALAALSRSAFAPASSRSSANPPAPTSYASASNAPPTCSTPPRAQRPHRRQAGYTSDAAFSRAFTRVSGAKPLNDPPRVPVPRRA